MKISPLCLLLHSIGAAPDVSKAQDPRKAVQYSWIIAFSYIQVFVSLAVSQSPYNNPMPNWQLAVITVCSFTPMFLASSESGHWSLKESADDRREVEWNLFTWMDIKYNTKMVKSLSNQLLWACGWSPGGVQEVKGKWMSATGCLFIENGTHLFQNAKKKQHFESSDSRTTKRELVH